MRRLLACQRVHLGFLVTSFSVSWCQGNTPRDASDEHTPESYQYVIIGCGVSGRAALREVLQHRRVEDRVLVVDPHRGPTVEAAMADGALTAPRSLAGGVEYKKCFVDGLDHRKKCIRLDDGSSIAFDKCLISVGSASVPIRSSYLESDEHVSRCIVDLQVEGAAEQLHATIRNGGHVTILGSNCFAALTLASQLAHTSRLRGRERGGSQVTMLFPSFGPLANVLPRYLSQAFLKRLVAIGVRVLPYTQLRYVGSTSQSNVTNAIDGERSDIQRFDTTTSNNDDNDDEVLVFAVKSYDALSTQSFATNRLVFVQSSLPSVMDRALPDDNEHYVGPSAAPFHRPLQHAHSFVVSSGLELDGLNGGIVVNQSLEACNGIYVSGDVASIYSSYQHERPCDRAVGSSGAVCFRGAYRGWSHAITTGSLAGYNMVHASRPPRLLTDYIPVFEGDCSDAGLYVAQVGCCSSAMESHGHWYKVVDDRRGGRAGGSAFGTSPPLGLGIVFYIHADRIAGVLISGLPTMSRSAEDAASSSSSSSPGKAVYADHVHHIAKSFIGCSVHSLSQHSLSETAQHNLSDAPQHLNSTTQILMGLNSAAAKIISPVLSPHLYESTEDADSDSDRAKALLSKYVYGQPLSEQTLRSYPRPQYKYAPASSATVKELEDSARKFGSVRPYIGREALFQTGADGSGSTADRISAAYRKGILRGPRH